MGSDTSGAGISVGTGAVVAAGSTAAGASVAAGADVGAGAQPGRISETKIKRAKTEYMKRLFIVISLSVC